MWLNKRSCQARSETGRHQAPQFSDPFSSGICLQAAVEKEGIEGGKYKGAGIGATGILPCGVTYRGGLT